MSSKQVITQPLSKPLFTVLITSGFGQFEMLPHAGRVGGVGGAVSTGIAGKRLPKAASGHVGKFTRAQELASGKLILSEHLTRGMGINSVTRNKILL